MVYPLYIAPRMCLRLVNRRVNVPAVCGLAFLGLVRVSILFCPTRPPSLEESMQVSEVSGYFYWVSCLVWCLGWLTVEDSGGGGEW
ncbi:hypothetical protein B0T17DRAFT_546477 [Bombardia bombarda]|uniref:Uncharacterized protein n=1 Tax=Bombardia bombarda TaxID=252184 RepID=A0AA39W3S5_9PEZI|nr:hypothetical protein B0T17DRAFT_546477 [Bombardia bombarda]